MEVTVISKGTSAKGNLWALVTYVDSGYVCRGWLRPASQETFDSLVEGEVIRVPKAAIQAAD